MKQWSLGRELAGNKWQSEDRMREWLLLSSRHVSARTFGSSSNVNEGRRESTGQDWPARQKLRGVCIISRTLGSSSYSFPVLRNYFQSLVTDLFGSVYLNLFYWYKKLPDRISEEVSSIRSLHEKFLKIFDVEEKSRPWFWIGWPIVPRRTCITNCKYARQEIHW